MNFLCLKRPIQKFSYWTVRAMYFLLIYSIMICFNLKTYLHKQRPTVAQKYLWAYWWLRQSYLMFSANPGLYTNSFLADGANTYAQNTNIFCQNRTNIVILRIKSSTRTINQCSILLYHLFHVERDPECNEIITIPSTTIFTIAA